MCWVSMILDHGRTLPNDFWTQETIKPFKKLVVEAEEYDRKTGQPDCEDPEKVAWLKKIKERLAALEGIMAEAVPRSRPVVDAAAPLRFLPADLAPELG